MAAPSLLPQLSSFITERPNIGVTTKIQAATFVKSEIPKEFEKTAQSYLAEPYTPKNYKQRDDSDALMKEFEERARKYSLSCDQYNGFKTAGTYGRMVLDAAGKTPSRSIRGIVGVRSVGEDQWSRKLERDKNKLIKVGVEVVRRLELTADDIAELKRLPVAEREKRVSALLNREIWQFKNQVEFPDYLRSEIARVFSHNIHLIDQLKKGMLTTDQEFRQMIQEAIQSDKNLRQKPQELKKIAQEMREDSKSTKKEFKSLRDQLNHYERGSREQKQLLRFLLDMQYKHLSKEEKIAAIKAGVYPNRVGELDTLELLNRWEKREKKWMDFTNVAIGTTQVLQQLGVRIPRDLQKGIVGSQHAFSVIAGVTTGNPLAIINGVNGIVGLFKKGGESIHAIYQKQLMDALGVLHQNDIVIMDMIREVQSLLNDLYQLNLEVGRAVNQIGIQIIQNHTEVMESLARIDGSLLYQQEVVVFQQLQFMGEFAELEEAKRKETVSGLFVSHSKAQEFFEVRWEGFKAATEGVRKIFQSNSLFPLNPLLRFRTVYNLNEGSFNRRFEEELWGAAYSYYAKLSAQQRNQLFPALFEPYIYLDSLNLRGEFEIGSNMRQTFEACRNLFAELISSKVILYCGRFMLDFHYYYPIIKRFVDGDLYSIDELIKIQESGDPQLQGKKNLKRILLFTNLSIIQNHLLAGGGLIPQFHEAFVTNLPQHIARMKNAATTQEERESLQNEVQQAVNLLAFNPLFAKNLMIYSIRRHLNINENDAENNQRFFSYRLAYNYKANPRPLQQLLPGWTLTPKDGDDNQEGRWFLKLPFSAQLTAAGRKIEEVEVELPLPNDLFYGRIEYPLELSSLVELRDNLIQEIISYDLPSHLHKKNKPELAKAIETNIMTTLYSYA